MSGISLAKSIELQLLHPLVTHDEVRAGCLRAGAAHIASVCVWPAHVSIAARELHGSDTRVRAAIGFPYGHDMPSIKLAACDRALADGADALAVMLDHTALTDLSDPAAAHAELDRVLEHSWWSALNAARGRAELTLVLETMLLEPAVLQPLLTRLRETPAGFLQTGSGHQPRTVTDHHVRTLRELLPADIAIVAVGGIATLEDAESLIAAGAVRIGSGSALAILDEERHLRDHATQAGGR